MSWRGGERQLQLLSEGLSRLNVSNYFAYPLKSKASERINKSQLLSLNGRSYFNPFSLLKVSQFIKEKKIQILHCHCSKAHSFGLVLKFIFPQLILIVHRRVAFQSSPLILSKKKYSSPLVNQYIAISTEVKQRLLETGVESSKIEVIPSAVDTTLYNCKSHEGQNFVRSHFKNEKNISDKCLYIGTASALTKEKGLADFIRALSLLIQKDNLPPFAVIMAGEGPLKAELKKIISSQNFPFPIKLIGFCHQVPLLLAGLDVFVMPSHHEGLGSVAIEALASGCTVISSDAGGLKEVVVNKEHGLSFQAKNIEQLCEQLELALKNEPLRKQLSLKGMQFVESHFSADQMVRACFELYKKLCVNNGKN